MFEKIKTMLSSVNPEMKELGKSLQEQENIKTNLHLALVQKLQKQNPYLIVGGSTALYLQGMRLERWKNALGDLDLLLPFYFTFVSEDGLFVKTSIEKSHTNDFDYALSIDNVIVDIMINPKQRYLVVNLDDVNYKVCYAEDIVAAKLKYAKEGNYKHQSDVMELLGIKKRNTELTMSDLDFISNSSS